MKLNIFKKTINNIMNDKDKVLSIPIPKSENKMSAKAIEHSILIEISYDIFEEIIKSN